MSVEIKIFNPYLGKYIENWDNYHSQSCRYGTYYDLTIDKHNDKYVVLASYDNGYDGENTHSLDNKWDRDFMEVHFFLNGKRI